jgi:hypothetical protein
LEIIASSGALPIFPPQGNIFIGNIAQKVPTCPLGCFNYATEQGMLKYPNYCNNIGTNYFLLPQGLPLGRKLSQFFLFFLFGPGYFNYDKP